MTTNGINTAAVEPLFGPSDPPLRHRARPDSPGASATIVEGRRPTPILIAQNLRTELAEWRDSAYAGASDTSRVLLGHWFGRTHETRSGDQWLPFAYYFCQREAMEALIYLYEVRQLRSAAAITAEFGGPDRERAALGIDPEEDAWTKYAFKIATGAGKTKIMSLAIAWSYFNSLWEDESLYSRDFLLIAPGVTVFERLQEDFRPPDGGPTIFETDPVIPPEWRGDWNVSVVLQDEPLGAPLAGTIYLTNIHRLFERTRTSKAADEMYPWMGPPVTKAKALDRSVELRQRIASHDRLMVMNDEAHHVWDPDSAWNEALQYLHKELASRGSGLIAQLDFSATPRDNKGNVFKHVVCDTPLGEAVDAGIVKCPVIGHGDQLIERPHDNAAYRFENHLTLGYRRWLQSRDEWDKAGKKALMFVMTENTEAADAIAQRLNSDPAYKELNGKTINLHTNLKGKLVKRGTGFKSYYEFVESEKAISPDDLEQLRTLSRQLDDNSSPYRCIVSVLMLREGWDVRNVTTIVPLRPLTAQSRILPEQTLGRGLRRMTPPGINQPVELVTVVEHKSFKDLYDDQLAQEGVSIEVVDVEKAPRTTVTIYPDAENKDLAELDLLVPQLSQGYRVEPHLEDMTIDDVRKSFERFTPLPLGKPQEREIRYEGRQLITHEVVEQMRVKLPLLADAVGAVSFFREELERAVKIKGTHAELAPLIQTFLEEVLFEEKVDLFDARLVSRVADADVREHVRATFLPLILAKVTMKEERLPEADPKSVTTWKPYQATHSETRPAETAARTPFNLVPCNLQFEVAMTHFLDRCTDVISFAKNQGPQALRIDCLNSEGRRAVYTPDFLVKKDDGNYLIIETKGRIDQEVPLKAKAAVEWCRAASNRKVKWEYVLVPQKVFERVTGDSVDDLTRACAPSLQTLLKQAESPQLVLNLEPTEDEALQKLRDRFLDKAAFDQLPQRFRVGVEHSLMLKSFLDRKEGSDFGAVFQPLLGPVDAAAEAVVVDRLGPAVPSDPDEQKKFFEPDTEKEFVKGRARALKRMLVHKAPIMPTGVLLFCLDFASKTEGASSDGLLAAIRERFSDAASTSAHTMLQEFYSFRNEYIAHQKEELSKDVAETTLGNWIRLLVELTALSPLGSTVKSKS